MRCRQYSKGEMRRFHEFVMRRLQFRTRIVNRPSQNIWRIDVCCGDQRVAAWSLIDTKRGIQFRSALDDSNDRLDAFYVAMIRVVLFYDVVLHIQNETVREQSAFAEFIKLFYQEWDMFDRACVSRICNGTDTGAPRFATQRSRQPTAIPSESPRTIDLLECPDRYQVVRSNRLLPGSEIGSLSAYPLQIVATEAGPSTTPPQTSSPPEAPVLDKLLHLEKKLTTLENEVRTQDDRLSGIPPQNSEERRVDSPVRNNLPASSGVLEQCSSSCAKSAKQNDGATSNATLASSKGDIALRLVKEIDANTGSETSPPHNSESESPPSPLKHIQPIIFMLGKEDASHGTHSTQPPVPSITIYNNNTPKSKCSDVGSNLKSPPPTETGISDVKGVASVATGEETAGIQSARSEAAISSRVVSMLRQFHKGLNSFILEST